MRPIEAAVTALNAVGVIMVVYAVTSSVPLLAWKPRLRAARLRINRGVLSALNFWVTATLLKTIDLRTWTALAAFAAILGLRVLVKTALTWEQSALLRSEATTNVHL